MSRTIPSRLRLGERADVVIMSREGLNALIAQGRIVTGSDVDLAETPLGVAVHAGTPKPRMDTVDSFVQMLLAAKSIAINSTTGVYLTKTLFPRLGVAEKAVAKDHRSSAWRRSPAARRSWRFNRSVSCCGSLASNSSGRSRPTCSSSPYSRQRSSPAPDKGSRKKPGRIPGVRRRAGAQRLRDAATDSALTADPHLRAPYWRWAATILKFGPGKSHAAFPRALTTVWLNSSPFGGVGRLASNRRRHSDRARTRCHTP